MSKKLIKSGMIVSGMTLASRVMGLVRDVVIADGGSTDQTLDIAEDAELDVLIVDDEFAAHDASRTSAGTPGRSSVGASKRASTRNTSFSR